MKRRVFLKTIGGAAGAAALGGPRIFVSAKPAPKAGQLQRRPLGRTGMKVSVVGFPGLVLAKHDQEQCTAALHSAFERGVNFFDVAPAYGSGDAEIKMGIGLQGLARRKYYLACKTKKRDKAGAQTELDRSLQRLKTDYFDLYQLHHLVRPAEVTDALGNDGALEVALKAKQAGKIRFIGFSAHTTKSAVQALKAFKFDTVMFPINFVEYYLRDFGKDVLALANEQGTGVISIKPISWGRWPKEGQRTREWWYNSVEEPRQVELAMRFVLSQKGVATALPTSFLELFDKTIEAARKFTPLDGEVEAELKQMAANRESIFLAEEQQVALNLNHWTPVYPDSPYEAGSLMG
ncbi:MAG TPA: aldo/keto reductase [Candidatus Paceibacterota bacterium]|nr:aldo/keto reductase [Verrucomicrobiota bacterium]HSA09845.1 aldo/keto reductase [Candidatus Paceibacterota bacterium]